MTPTDKDIAEFVVLAWEFKFLGLPQIVAWGDEVIETQDDPPTACECCGSNRLRKFDCVLLKLSEILK